MPRHTTSEQQTRPASETFPAFETHPANDQFPTTDEWMRHMRRGEWEAAWRVSDSVLRARAGQRCWHLPRHLQYVWDGRPLAGHRVLVRCYHGLGDTIQFIRFTPLLKRIAAQVNVWAQPQLIPLLRTVRCTDCTAGIDSILPLHDGAPDLEYDVDIEIMELPHALRTTAATLPAAVPYIHVEPAPRVPSDGMVVGLVWASGDWDARRSIPLSLIQRLLLQPLSRRGGISWQILQRGTALAEWHRQPRNRIGELPQIDTILEEARAMRALDLLICVDTMLAHLAGALGVQTWTLLHSQPDWRWTAAGETTPWYPTMRLIRQKKPGDWASVIERVATRLRRLT